MSYYVTNDNSFLDIKNAHLRVTGNVHTDVMKLGAVEFAPSQSTVAGTVNFTNVTTGVTTSSNLSVGGTLSLGTIEVVATTHTLANTTALGNETPHTIQFSNVTTGIVTTANVEVGGDLSVTGVFYAAGSAVQIQTSVFTDAPSTSDSTWKDISSTFGATITPKFSNSKFLIQAMIHQGGDQNDDARWTMYRIGRYISGALTEVGNGNTSTTGGAGTACVAAHNWGASGASDGNTYDLNIANINILYVDQPNTTSPITYRIRWNSNPGGSGTRTAYINRSDGHTDGYRANTTCTLVVTEIAQ